MRRLPVLPNLRIASPCRASWDEMIGTTRVRSCATCEKQVYNLSELTRDEAEALIIAHAGSLCVRYYQRSDGTILLKDCTYHQTRGGWLPAAVVAATFGIAVVASTPDEHDEDVELAQGGVDAIEVHSGGVQALPLVLVAEDGALLYRGVAIQREELFDTLRASPPQVPPPYVEGMPEGPYVIVQAHAYADAAVVNGIVAIAKLAGFEPLFAIKEP